MSVFDNLAYCCIFCNRYKGSDVAAIDSRTGEAIRLFHPRMQRWQEGEVTARLLRFNQAERIVERVILQNAGPYPRSNG